MYHYSTDNVGSMDISEVVKSKPSPSQLPEDMKDDAHSDTGMYRIFTKEDPWAVHLTLGLHWGMGNI